MPTLLDDALRYLETYGWSILPVAGKKPIGRWKQFQREPAGRKELQTLFSFDDRVSGLAVVCGPVSHDLVCRDFDQVGAYDLWACEQPELASTLPTARTARGFHVYCRSPGAKGIKKTGDGELRSSGGICLLPESRHPTGTTYQWIVPPGTEIPLLLDTSSLEKGNSSPPHTDSLHVSCICQSVEEAIETTLPHGPGQRNRRIFDLVLQLKRLLGADAKPAQLREVVRTWHGRALPVITTKGFDDTWLDFGVAWRRAKALPFSMEDIIEDAKSRPTPPAGMIYEKQELRLLVALVATLQQTYGDAPFFLSVRKAAKVLGVDRTTAHGMLQVLQFDGLLEQVKLGTLAGNKATKWRYRGGA